MEADLSRTGRRLRDICRPSGDPERLTLRELGSLVRHLPMESHTAKAVGGHGFSMLELLVMENGIHGELNPRHPFVEAERVKAKSRNQLLEERQAYYAARSAGQDRDGEDQAKRSKGERKQEADLNGALAVAVGGASDDARDVDAQRDGEPPLHEGTVTPEGGGRDE